MSNINILQGIITGCLLAQEEKLNSVSNGTPTLRGGNSGCLTDDGKIIGRCGREAVMRYFGVDKQFDYSKRLMFDAGERVETMLIDWLKHSWQGGIKTQDEVATSWTTDNGFVVTGSPDIGLTDESGNIIHGLEVKNCSSIWTATKVASFGPYRDGKPQPKIDAVVQAAHYSMAHGFIPFSIVYTSTNNWAIPFTQKALRNYDGYPEYFDRRSDGNVNIVPFVSVFDLSWDGDRAVVTHQKTGHTIVTPITASGIRNYYNLLGDCIEQRRLPQRSSTVDVYGKAEKWSMYDATYNDFSELHNQYDSGQLGFDEFIERSKHIARFGGK